jgi:hypothetical protein
MEGFLVPHHAEKEYQFLPLSASIKKVKVRKRSLVPDIQQQQDNER